MLISNIQCKVHSSHVIQACICLFHFPYAKGCLLALIFLTTETEYQLHAKEVSRSLDLTKYDGIICVSGDGILVEVGLLPVIMKI